MVACMNACCSMPTDPFETEDPFEPVLLERFRPGAPPFAACCRFFPAELLPLEPTELELCDLCRFGAWPCSHENGESPSCGGGGCCAALFGFFLDPEDSESKTGRGRMACVVKTRKEI